MASVSGAPGVPTITSSRDGPIARSRADRKKVNADGCDGFQLVALECPHPDDAVDGTYKNHGDYVSSIAQAQQAEKKAERDEAKAERDAAKAERDAEKAEKKAERDQAKQDRKGGGGDEDEDDEDAEGGDES